MPEHKRGESVDLDSAGTYFVTVEDFEWRPATEGDGAEPDVSESRRPPSEGDPSEDGGSRADDSERTASPKAKDPGTSRDPAEDS